MQTHTIPIKKIGLLLTVGFVFFIFGILHDGALGAEYPTKPIQIIWPFPPGGTGDLMTRLMTDKLSALLGQPVVVFNKGGGRRCRHPNRSICTSRWLYAPWHSTTDYSDATGHQRYRVEY